MIIVGVDCGVKSLAISRVEFNFQFLINNKSELFRLRDSWRSILGKLKDFIKRFKGLQKASVSALDYLEYAKNVQSMLKEYQTILKEYQTLLAEKETIMREQIRLFSQSKLVTILDMDLYDLCPGKTVKKATLDNLLKSLKTKLIKYDSKQIDRVCIEYQMSKTDKPRIISHAIFYHFIGRPNCEVGTISACLKNNLQYGKINIDSFANEKGKRSGKQVSKYSANKKHATEMFKKYIEDSGNKRAIKHIPKQNLKDIADSFWTIVAFLRFKSKRPFPS